MRCMSVGEVRRIAAAAAVCVALGYSAQTAHAVGCQVVHHGPQSDADKALALADYAKAEDLYRKALEASPGNADLVAGLVHTLLRDQKVKEADAAVSAALAAFANQPALLALRGEVEYREGEPWAAAQTASASLKLDPCNPRTYLLIARLDTLNSLYAAARTNIESAHKLDADDPEIRFSWITTLPVKQRVTELEAYLAEPRGEDADEARQLKQSLDRLKKIAAGPPKQCHLVSQTTATQIPFVYLMSNGTHVKAFGLEVKLNNHSSRLEIDTGAGGIVVSSAVAKRAGLTSFAEDEVGGIGDKGFKKGYTAYVDSIKIGGLEFQNCQVQVVDLGTNMECGRTDRNGCVLALSGHAGLSHAPALAGPAASAAGSGSRSAKLKHRRRRRRRRDDRDAAGSAGADKNADANDGASKPAPHGPYDRYIAPEMKDYAKVYRAGHDLIFPVTLNNSKVRLFIMDTGSWSTVISPDAAREVTKVRGDTPFRVTGVSGDVEKVSSADEIVFRFANVEQKDENVIALNTATISKSTGMEISGLLGATMLRQLVIHIDYRDGLVKFEYDPKHGYHY